MIRDELAAQAHGLFLAGYNTMAIAARMKVPESQASKLVWIGRCRAKGLPARYINHNGRLTEANPDVLKKSA